MVGSGIQDASGGVARFYRSDERRNAPVSTEITGYGAAALMWLHVRTGGPEYFTAASAAGRFLTRTAWDPARRIFPFELANGNGTGPRAYFFDCGIVVRSLIALWRASGDREFLDRAAVCGESMARCFDGGAAFHAIVSLPGLEPVAPARGWSRRPGCYQLKAALAWLELAEETGCRALARQYDRMLAAALAGDRGFLPGDADPSRVMDRLHAYAYFLEGLLPFALRPDCRRALASGVERAAVLLRRIAPGFARSDVYAQLLRIRLFADAIGAVPLDACAAAEEAAMAAAFQLRSDDPRVDGGFAFGHTTNRLLPHVNPVSTAFCAQALQLWQDYRTGRFEPDWRVLI